MSGFRSDLDTEKSFCDSEPCSSLNVKLCVTFRPTRTHLPLVSLPGLPARLQPGIPFITSLYGLVSVPIVALMFPTTRPSVKERGRETILQVRKYHGVSGAVLSILQRLTPSPSQLRHVLRDSKRNQKTQMPPLSFSLSLLFFFKFVPGRLPTYCVEGGDFLAYLLSSRPHDLIVWLSFPRVCLPSGSDSPSQPDPPSLRAPVTRAPHCESHKRLLSSSDQRPRSHLWFSPSLFPHIQSISIPHQSCLLNHC